MVFTNNGKNRIRDLFDGDLSYGRLGSGTTAATVSDSSLQTSTANSQISVTTSSADKQVISDYSLPSSLLQGSTVSEYGVFGTTGVLFSRFVFSNLTHSSTDQWQISTRHWMD